MHRKRKCKLFSYHLFSIRQTKKKPFSEINHFLNEKRHITFMKSVMIKGEEHLVIANTGKFEDKEVHKKDPKDEYDQLEESLKAYE